MASDAAAVSGGEDVRVAGISVGKVSSVELRFVDPWGRDVPHKIASVKYADASLRDTPIPGARIEGLTVTGLLLKYLLPPGSGGVRRPDEPVTLRIALRNPTDEELVFGTPRLALSAGLRHNRWKGARVAVAPRSVATFDLEVRPAHTGRHVLHGAWMTLSGPLGIAWAPLYFPNPLLMEVQPRAFGGAVHTRARAAPEQRMVGPPGASGPCATWSPGATKRCARPCSTPATAAAICWPRCAHRWKRPLPRRD